MNKIKKVLDKIYNNLELRRRNVPLFMGDPGLGKTWIIEEFAKSVGAHVELFLTSSKPPFEIDGIGIPNTQRTKAKHVEFENILKLKDGDILFFDELPNGNLATLNASLTFIESRITASGRKMPDIMIVGAGNFQGMTPMTPQIKRRFIWYKVEFDAPMWQKFMFDRYKIPFNISFKLCSLIKSEKFDNYNFYTPADIDKAVERIIYGMDSTDPYSPSLLPILNTLITNNLDEDIEITKDKKLFKGETIKWLDLIRYSKEDFNINLLDKNNIVNIDEKGEYEIVILNNKKEVIGEIKNIDALREMYNLSESEILCLESGEYINIVPFLLREGVRGGLVIGGLYVQKK